MKHCALFLLIFGIGNLSLAQPTEFKPKGSGGGGYMYSPAISPFNQNELYLVCDMGGVYKSSSEGHMWEVYPYQQIIGTVKSQIQFTSSADTLYTVAKSLSNTSDPWFKAEPTMSTDAGKTWVKINDPTTTGVHALYANPHRTNQIILNEYDKLFFSNNSGETYSTIYQSLNSNCWLGGIFWDENLIIVAINDGLLISTDDGDTFTFKETKGIPETEAIFKMNGAKDGNVIRLFATTVPKEKLFPWLEVIDLYHDFKELYVLDFDKDSAWTSTRNNIPKEVSIRWVDLAQNNINTVYAAGDLNYQPFIFKSKDGGKTWVNTFKVINNENIYTGWGGDGGYFSYLWGGGALGFNVCKSNPEKVISTDGFSFMTKDGGETWYQLHVNPINQNLPGELTQNDAFYQSSGLDVTTGHSMIWLGKDTILMGCTDIGNQYSEDGGESWSFKKNILTSWGSLTFPNWYQIIKPKNQNILYAAVSEINDIYLGYRISDNSIEGTLGRILKSEDNGITWQTILDLAHPIVWVAIDPNDNQKLFASVVDHIDGGIFRSLDGGNTWNKLNLPSRTEGRPYTIRVLKDGGVVASFCARAQEDQVTLTPSSGVFYSPDGGDTWFDRTDSRMQFYTKDIIIDLNDSEQNTWYASTWGRFTVFEGLNNSGNGGIYRTKNRGLTWERIFSHERAESMAIDPLNPNRMYVALELEGLFYTNDLNTFQFPTFQRLESFPFARPKRIFFDNYNQNTIWVTTMGGSVWKGQSKTSNTNYLNNVFGELIISPNPFSEILNIQYESKIKDKAELIIFTTTGTEVYKQNVSVEEGKNQFQIKLNEKIDPALYILQLKSKFETRYSKIIKY